MRIISWNVNGIPSKVESGAFATLEARSPDAVCVQEVRTKREPIVLPDYHHIWNHSERDGFWGTLTLSREEPMEVIRNLGSTSLDREGRLIACEYQGLWLVNVYVPNASGSLRRKAVRREWDGAIAELVLDLAERKPVVMCGDFNVPLTVQDIYAGNGSRRRMEEDAFPTDEQSRLAGLLEEGFVDAFRHMHPDDTDAYTWWAQRKGRRGVNHGWRLDYFLVSQDVKWDIVRCEHLTDVMGSDHCPIELEVML